MWPKRHWKQAGGLTTPKGITKYSKLPNWFLNIVGYFSLRNPEKILSTPEIDFWKDSGTREDFQGGGQKLSHCFEMSPSANTPEFGVQSGKPCSAPHLNLGLIFSFMTIFDVIYSIRFNLKKIKRKKNYWMRSRHRFWGCTRVECQATRSEREWHSTNTQSIDF